MPLDVNLLCLEEFRGEGRIKNTSGSVGVVDCRIVDDASFARSSLIRNSGLHLRNFTGLRAINSLNFMPEIPVAIIRHIFVPRVYTNSTRVCKTLQA